MITRRRAIRQLLVLGAVGAIVPACLNDNKKPPVAYKHLSVDADDVVLIEHIADTLIPATDSPGARDISAHLFVLKMVDDCRTKAEQEEFTTGMRSFRKLAKDRLDCTFPECDRAQREAFLKTLEDKKDIPEDVSSFYSTVKRETVHAYLTSEFYLTKIEVYELSPGRFHGCVPVKKSA